MHHYFFRNEHTERIEHLKRKKETSILYKRHSFSDWNLQRDVSYFGSKRARIAAFLASLEFLSFQWLE